MNEETPETNLKAPPDLPMPEAREQLRRAHILSEIREEARVTQRVTQSRRLGPKLGLASAGVLAGALLVLLALNPFSPNNAGIDPVLGRASAKLNDPNVIWYFREHGKTLGGRTFRSTPPLVSDVWVYGNRFGAVERRNGRLWRAGFYDGRTAVQYEPPPRASIDETVISLNDDSGEPIPEPTKKLKSLLNDPEYAKDFDTRVVSKTAALVRGHAVTKFVIEQLGRGDAAFRRRNIYDLYIDDKTSLPVKLLDRQFLPGNRSNVPDSEKVTYYDKFKALPATQRNMRLFRLPRVHVVRCRKISSNERECHVRAIPEKEFDRAP